MSGFASDREELDGLTEDDEQLFNILDSYEIPDDDLQSIGKLAAHLVTANRRVEQAEELLRRIKQQRDSLSNEVLPSRMDALGISELKLDDGSSISVETYYQASLPADSKDDALNWLEAEGHGDIIKHEVKVSLKKGQSEEAEMARRQLENVGLEPITDLGVHSSTLRAFVREEVEAGRKIDPSINVFVGRRTKIK